MNESVQTVVGSIVVVGAMTRCALLNSVFDLKTAQMNVPHRLTWELMLHKFELGHIVAEVTKNIYCTKDGGTVDHRIVSR